MEIARAQYVRLAERLNSLAFSAELCIGCGMCVEVCPHGVFTMRSSRAAPARAEACIECGACARNCPVDAIRVDAGVGCAVALIRAALTGGEPRCGPGCCGASADACACEDTGSSAGGCGGEGDAASCACRSPEGTIGVGSC